MREGQASQPVTTTRARRLARALSSGIAITLCAATFSVATLGPPRPKHVGPLPSPAALATIAAYTPPSDFARPARPRMRIAPRVAAADKRDRIDGTPVVAVIAPPSSRRSPIALGSPVSAAGPNDLLAFASKASRTRGQPMPV